MGSDSDDLEGSKTLIPHLSPLDALFEDEKTTVGASSSGAGDLETQKTTSIPKEVLDDISAKLGPIGALLKEFENPRSSKKIIVSKHRNSKILEQSIEISSPSTTMETKTPQDFERDLPVLLHEFAERLSAVCQNMPKGKLKDFRQLFSSFRDVEEIYQKYNPDYQTVPEEKQRRHHVKRRATVHLVQRKQREPLEKLTISSHGDTIVSSIQQSLLFQKMCTNSQLDSLDEEDKLSESSSLSSALPSLRFLRFAEESSSSSQPLPVPTPSSPPLTPGRRNIAGSSPELLVRSMNGSSSPSIPLSPRSMEPIERSSSSSKSPPVPPRLINGSPSSFRRPLPKVPQVSPQGTLPSFPPPPVPHRSRSISSPPEKKCEITTVTPLPLGSSPGSKRWASYHPQPFVSPSVIETDPSEFTSDESGVYSLLEMPER
ncbi:MAG: hypothetical protein K2W92_07040 [Alphaproteobacteria bacterium]|nr:hypothetical protein [Alphaproteobacteria bacterium]